MTYRFRGLLLAGLLVGSNGGIWAQQAPAPFHPAHHAGKDSRIRISPVEHNGWPNSYLISNGKVEVVVVPAIGRVMQFRFVGEDGPLWENGLFYAKLPDPRSSDWGNFGGDKSWPAEQANWEKMTGRNWPPPAAFDAMAVEAKVDGDELVLTAALDPGYGIRETRRIKLSPLLPEMAITTTYEKVSGDPVPVAVWVITQMREPERVFMLLPEKSAYPKGYNQQLGDTPPQDLKLDGRLLSLTRDAKAPHKIGSDGSSLLWMDDKYVLQIDSRRIPGVEYPDQGSSTEVYTNPDPLPYVELEMLGPLATMKVGDTLERTSTYRLSRRTTLDPGAEAKRSFGLAR
ncbi:MAG TPA: hypothetical protein VK473_06315 [Terriglobales bacterium]|nr:hypothetical protein [Terriglobales bacterium]